MTSLEDDHRGVIHLVVVVHVQSDDHRVEAVGVVGGYVDHRATIPKKDRGAVFHHY